MQQALFFCVGFTTKIPMLLVHFCNGFVQKWMPEKPTKTSFSLQKHTKGASKLFQFALLLLVARDQACYDLWSNVVLSSRSGAEASCYNAGSLVPLRWYSRMCRVPCFSVAIVPVLFSGNSSQQRSQLRHCIDVSWSAGLRTTRFCRHRRQSAQTMS